MVHWSQPNQIAVVLISTQCGTYSATCHTGGISPLSAPFLFHSLTCTHTRTHTYTRALRSTAMVVLQRTTSSPSDPSTSNRVPRLDEQAFFPTHGRACRPRRATDRISRVPVFVGCRAIPAVPHEAFAAARRVP